MGYHPTRLLPGRLGAALLAALAFTAASGDALAQSDGDRATARSLAQEGHKALDRKDFATAADAFARADALVHAPTLLLGRAQADVGLGKLVSAEEAYRRILREGVAPSSPPAFARALREAQVELDALSPRIPTLTIQLSGSKSASVTIDGEPIPAAAIGVKRPVDPGRHLIRATAAGMKPAEATLTVDERRNEAITIELTPDLTAPSPVAAPAAAPPAPAATPADTRPPPGRPPVLAIAGFTAIGLGGAGLALGAVTGGLAVSKHHSLVTSTVRSTSDVGTYHTLGNLSTAGFIAGGVLAAGGVVLVLTAPKRPSAAARVSPWIGVGQIGVSGEL